MFFKQPEFKDFKDEAWYREWLLLAHQNQHELYLPPFNYNDVETRLEEEFNKQNVDK